MNSTIVPPLSHSGIGSSPVFMFDHCTIHFQEYSEDSNSEPDVDLENQYYNSKALKEDDPRNALTSFQKVLDLEGGEKGEWGFKALKQMIKINFKLVLFIYLYYIINHYCCKYYLLF